MPDNILARADVEIDGDAGIEKNVPSTVQRHADPPMP
jgi:hypothetical protein